MSKTFYLFDIDGTLLYSEKRDSQCFADSYASIFGRPFPTIDWTRFPEVTDHVIFRTAFHDHFQRYPTEVEREAFEEHYLAALTQVRSQDGGAFREVPGAVRYWQKLENDPAAIVGIATGGWQKPAAIKLAHVGLPPTPPYAGFANNKFSRVDILQAAIDLASNDHPIDRIVYFGDAIWDLTTTRKMNIPFVGIRHKGDHAKLTEHGHRFVLTDYEDHEAVERLVKNA